MNEEKCETLALENRRRLNMTGVTSVDGFTAEALRLTLANGRATVTGEGLKIVGFNKQTGALTAEGQFTGVRFHGKKGSALGKIFR